MANDQSKWLILIEEQQVLVCLLCQTGSFFVAKPKSWNGASEEDLMAALDSGLGESLSLSEKQASPKKGILVLPPSWINPEGEVLEGKKELLKNVCQKFSFSPLGFLIGEEIIANFNADFFSVYLGAESSRLSLIVNSEVVSTEYLSIGFELSPEELISAIRKMTGEKSLPPKLIFWGQTEQMNSDLTSYAWKKEKGLV